MESYHPNFITYHIEKQGPTHNFDITYYKPGENPNGPGVEVYSKVKHPKKLFPHKDEAVFKEMVDKLVALVMGQANPQNDPMLKGMKLYYFNFYGRAEYARMMLAKAGVAYENILITQAEWPTMKTSGKFEN